MIAAALTIAALAFGPTPCAPRIQWESGYATAYGYVTPDCTIHLSHDLLDGRRALTCHTIVHEYGHLTGRTHSRNPRSVMFWRPARIYPPCLV
jgi:hypothetical protein